MVSENSRSIEELLEKYETQAHWEFLTEEEKYQWAWLAGIIDGEGCINLRSSQNRKTGVRRYDLRLTVQMNHKSTVQNIKQITNVGHIHTRLPRKATHHIAYCWRCGDRIATRVLRNCLPLLVTKKAQAVLAIEFVETQKWGTNKLPSPSEIAKRESLIRAVHLLNQEDEVPKD